MKLRKGFVVLLVLFMLVFSAVLELGHHTVFGWIAMLLISVGYLALHIKGLSQKKWYFRLFGWFCFIVVMLGIWKLSYPPAKRLPAVNVENPAVTEVVSVKQGKLTGVYTEDKKVEVYAGIPYAKPPVGELRWKEPQEPEKWSGIRACDTFGPMSMQSQNVYFDSLMSIFAYHDFKISLNDNFREEMSEDSLYLNIWKPAGDIKDAPVLVFIHGGSLRTGRSSYGAYNGEALAKKGIIVVNFAYRLNVFGYYANEQLAEESENGTTGNYGLLDQIQALKWVNENIASFGGNPDEITLAGESAGSSSVNAICVSPLAKGLFKRAVAESSGISAKVPYHTYRNLSSALEMGNNIMDEFGAETVGELREIPAEKLVNTKFINSAMTLDGYAITRQPYETYVLGENNEQALLNGFNSHEADAFLMTARITSEDYENALEYAFGKYAPEVAKLVPPAKQDDRYKMIIDFGGDAKGSYDRVMSAAWMTYSHYNWSRLVAKQGKDVYEYYFTKYNGAIGSFHAGEMPYLYGNLFRNPGSYDDSDYALSETMQNYLVNFVKTGNPNGEGLPEWKKFNEDETKVLEFGNEVKMVDEPNYELYKIIDKYQDDAYKALKGVVK